MPTGQPTLGCLNSAVRCLSIRAHYSDHGPEPRVERLHALQQIAEAIGILDVGRMHENAEQQPVGVHRDLAH